MNAQELDMLKHAAKAAGYEVEWNNYSPKTNKYHKWQGVVDGICICGHFWNPLEDNSDAFVLAVDLGMAVEISNRKLVWVASEDLQHTLEIRFADGGDTYTAVRLAIVRAAAEIGRNMKC